MEPILITSPRILSFFENNKEIDPEQAFGIMCDFMSAFLKIQPNNEPLTLDALQQNTQVLQSLCHSMNQIPKQINKEVEGSLRTIHQEMIERIGFHIQSIITSVQSQLSGQIDHLSSQMKVLVLEDISQIKKGETSVDQIASNLTQTLQNHMISYVADSETRLTSQLSFIRDQLTKTALESVTFGDSVKDLVRKLDTTKGKGTINENLLGHVLSHLIPRCTVENVTTQKETGDYMFYVEKKPKVLIETKSFSTPVPEPEIKKFIRDTAVQNCCGLFISQNTPIACKNNFEINLQEGNVLLYLHNVNNDPQTIKNGLEAIYYIKERLDELDFHSENGAQNIPKEVLDEINREFQEFMIQKSSLIQWQQDQHKATIDKLQKLQFPGLERFLQTKYAFSKTESVICEYCGEAFANTYKKGAHIRKDHKDKVHFKREKSEAIIEQQS